MIFSCSLSAITEPGGDTYSPNSGIWQTVWLESVPQVYIQNYRVVPTLSSIELSVGTNEPTELSVSIYANNVLVTKTNLKSNQTITIPIPSPKLWSPDSPFLYDMRLATSYDVVDAYFGLRTFRSFAAFALFIHSYIH